MKQSQESLAKSIKLLQLDGADDNDDKWISLREWGNEKEQKLQ